MATCTDTLARASEARSKQGTHELEISFGGEADLHKHCQNCTKNPGHLNFIPINSLDMHHLPEVFRTMKTFDWIQYIAKRTVQLSVRSVSSHRQPPLPLSDYAGEDILTVGSGFMSYICSVEGKHEMPCPFDNCPEQPGQHQVYGYIIITTAAHVVFDGDEAKNTTVEFFYDNPNDRSNVRTARGVKVGAVSVEGDFCELLCVTHDRQVLDSIEENMHFKEDKSVTLVRDEVRISCSHFRGYIRTPHFYVECRKKDDIACPLEECQYLSESHNVYGYIFVKMDADAMFDYEKVKSATIEFFYMDPEDSRNILTARAEVVNDVNVDEDFCELQCVTHDKQLFDFLTHQIYKQNLRSFIDEESINSGLFQRYPCIEHVRVRERYLRPRCQEISVDISLNNISHCAELLVFLLTYNIDKIVNAMQTICFIKNMILFEQEINVDKIDDNHITINGQIELNTSLVRINISYLKLFKYQELVLQLKTLLMAVPVNVDSLNKFLTESVDKETNNNIFVRQIGEKMLQAICIKSGHFDDVLDEYFQRSNIDDVFGKNFPRSNLDGVLDEYFQISNIEDRDNEHGTSHDKLVVHISHPHGQSKQISFGTQTDCFTGDGHYKPLYTAPTCPGCSGGPVWMISATEELTEIYGVPHGGCHDNQLNHGCSWTLYPQRN